MMLPQCIVQLRLSQSMNDDIPISIYLILFPNSRYLGYNYYLGVLNFQMVLGPGEVLCHSTEVEHCCPTSAVNSVQRPTDQGWPPHESRVLLHLCCQKSTLDSPCTVPSHVFPGCFERAPVALADVPLLLQVLRVRHRVVSSESVVHVLHWLTASPPGRTIVQCGTWINK